MKKLPESSIRINVVELKNPIVLFCLVNVYLPARGLAENESLFAECLDELHEIFVKYVPTHTIFFGGDFNASLHRGSHLHRDVLFREFVEEHELKLDSNYPVQDTFFHASSDSSSQIDYFLVGPSRVPLQSVVTISDMHHLNLSDHTHLEICISAKDQLTGAKDFVPAINTQPRIRWEKYDLELYSDVVTEKLSIVSPIVECSLDAELLVRTISSTLRKASEMSCPERKKRKTKKGFPVWNDRIATAVHNSKVAQFEWKKAGKPSDAGCYSHKRRREARKALRREVRFTLFQQRQDLLGSVMNASEQDTKLFHRLVRKQRARPSTATETLKYDGNTLSGAEEIAAGFSSHFRDLATPAPNASFDGEYFRQVQYDALVIEDLCNRQSISSFKPVTANEISSIIRSFRNGKAQDINGLSAEHLKYAAGTVALPLANLMNFILSTGYIPPVLLEGLLTPVPKKDKDQTLPTNYRGITVLSILRKVLEKVLQGRTESLLTRNQSRLQRGFTKKSSSVNAALLISEVQNVAKDKGEFLTLVTLDAAKAFDVVWQA